MINPVPHHAMTDIARNRALQVLNQLNLKNNHHLDRLMTDLIDGISPALSPRDRRFVNMLIYGVLRWRGRIDWIIQLYSKTPIEKINPDILNILRLGIFQLFFLDRVPDSAAVNTAVELAKQTAPPWVVKYVNAVLRSAARGGKNLTFPSVKKSPAEAVSVLKSFPRWLIKRWLARFGQQECENLCDAFNAIPPITVRCNTLKTTRKELLEKLLTETESVNLAADSPDGVHILNPVKPIHELSAFKNGWFQVQDEAAQLVTRLLAPGPHETLLDACAGMGGKTGHLAQLMNNTGQIVAADQDSGKLGLLADAMVRLGVKNVATRVYDFARPEKPLAEAPFDRILLDAPCSGLGVIRRNPDIKWDIARKNLIQFQKKQRDLLDNVGLLVKPGGIIVYVVCSFEPEENEGVIDFFLSAHSHFKLDTDISLPMIDIRPYLDARGFFRTFPHIHGMDGFFAAVLKRTQ